MVSSEFGIPKIVLNPRRFEGQVAVITGSAQGIGQVVATLFAEQGARVVLLDINIEKLEEVKRTLVGRGLEALFEVCDLTDEDQVHRTVDAIVKLNGRIDIFAHVAGIYPAKPLLETTTLEYRKIFQVNMDSCFFLTQAVLPYMQKRGYGRIINTASTTIVKPEPGLSVYVASKSAVAGFTKATATEAGPGVTANCVSPTLTVTETTLGFEHTSAAFEPYVNLQCVKRSCLPQDVAHAIMYLASPEAEFITGQVFGIGGGSFFA
ncbi:hypothetical protein LTR84_004397 [Exophiala bonariae]|uniref:3-oxoacyl-[acyl-carrier protein] reductase n=1 Tax=Exophiala bonariae TaxID=1690606 RepID=A0AAV9N4Y9_9EURO|nr:hypothetical protein LTR84_004397 [Exophiala bonariae]